MPDYTVIITAEYVISDVGTPREAIETALARSQYPGKLTAEAVERDA
jgi:uncharacterized protein (UPF0212 family)